MTFFLNRLTPSSYRPYNIKPILTLRLDGKNSPTKLTLRHRWRWRNWGSPQCLKAILKKQFGIQKKIQTSERPLINRDIHYVIIFSRIKYSRLQKWVSVKYWNCWNKMGKCLLPLFVQLKPELCFVLYGPRPKLAIYSYQLPVSPFSWLSFQTELGSIPISSWSRCPCKDHAEFDLA